MPKAPLIDYAPAPRPMSRARFAVLVGSISGATILIAGTTYELVSATTQPVIMGDMVALPPVVCPTTAPAVPPALPGALMVAPATQFSPATTRPVEK